MKEKHLNDELNWLLIRRVHYTNKSISNWKFGVVIVLLFLLALTPFFCVIHPVISYLLPTMSYQDGDFDLPLFVALIGGREEIVQLFFDNGVHLSDLTKHGNTIFHVLVQYSKSEPEKAYKCYCLLWDVASETELHEFKRLITSPRHSDSNGLTALETCAKYGAPVLFNAMCESEGIIKTTSFRASRYKLFKTIKSNTSYQRNEQEIELVVRDEKLSHEDAVEEEIHSNRRVSSEELQPSFSESVAFDVGMYETLSIFGRQSMLLILLTFRSTRKLSKGGAVSFLDNRLVKAWINKKKYANYMKISGYLIRLLLVILVLVLAVQSVSDLDHLPFTLQYFKLIVDETEGSTDCTNTTATLGNINLDSCALAALNTLEDACEEEDVNVTRYLSANDPGYLTDILSASGGYTTLIIILFVVAVINIIWSTFRSVMFLCQCLRTSDLDKAINFVFATRIPGSSVDHFLILMSSWMMVGFMWLIVQLDSVNAITEDVVNEFEALSYIFCLYLVFLCMAFVHSLRLLPGIGPFVITTLKMAIHIAMFMVVYGFVYLVVSYSFYYIMREKDCRAVRIDEFSTMWSSMFETFKLLLGHGEDFHYGEYNSAAILYIAYCVFCVLLLLNFIIAVMGSTIDTVFHEPWRSVSLQRVHLQECLISEVLLLCLLWPFENLLRNKLIDGDEGTLCVTEQTQVDYSRAPHGLLHSPKSSLVEEDDDSM